jgi:putative transposase
MPSVIKHKSAPLKLVGIKGNVSIFLCLFGISVEHFEALLLKVRDAWSAQVVAKYKRPGRPCKLALAEQLMVVLLRLRANMNMAVVGYFFGVDTSTVCRIIKRMEPLLEVLIKISKNPCLTPEIVHQLIVDAAETPIERPKFEIPDPDVRIIADAGYQGIRDVHANSIHVVRRNKSGSPILRMIKRIFNMMVARQRVKVEQIFGKIKAYKIISDRYRHDLSAYERKFRIVAWLVNIKSGFCRLMA